MQMHFDTLDIFAIMLIFWHSNICSTDKNHTSCDISRLDDVILLPFLWDQVLECAGQVCRLSKDRDRLWFEVRGSTEQLLKRGQQYVGRCQSDSDSFSFNKVSAGCGWWRHAWRWCNWPHLHTSTVRYVWTIWHPLHRWRGGMFNGNLGRGLGTRCMKTLKFLRKPATVFGKGHWKDQREKNKIKIIHF